MRRLLLLAVSVVPFMTFLADDASAQRHFGEPGFHGGGIRAGGYHGGVRAMGVRAGRYGPGYRTGFIPGRTRWQVGPDRWHRGPYIGPGWGWRRGWGYPGYYGGWGAAGLVAGTAIGAAAAYPYSYPYSYPVYAEPEPYAVGGYCATPVRTCALIEPGVVGSGCSCRVSDGRARGTVVGP